MAVRMLKTVLAVAFLCMPSLAFAAEAPLAVGTHTQTALERCGSQIGMLALQNDQLAEQGDNLIVKVTQLQARVKELEDKYEPKQDHPTK